MSLPDPASFVLARISEVEDAARATDAVTRWVVTEDAEVFAVYGDLDGPQRCSEHPRGVPNMCDDIKVAEGYDFTDQCDVARARHVAQHDPAHVLAWCAAIRAVVELHRHEAKGPGPVLYDGSRDLNEGVFGCVICSCVDDDPGWHFTGGWCDTVRLHAAVWSAHPDFDPAWRL